MQKQGLYEFEEFRLDVSSGFLIHSGKPLKLAPKVYNALVYLIENRDRIVSKDELFTEVWQNTFVEDNALSYTISQLRKALATCAPETTFIETIPRRGFRFVADVIETETGSIERKPLSLVIEKQTVEETWIEEVDDERSVEFPSRRQLALPPVERGGLKRLLAIGMVAVLALGIVGAAWVMTRESKGSPIRTVAVMPLENISGTEIDRSILLGMTYALISQLGRSGDIVVRPLASTISASATEPDAVAVGKRLGVNTVVEWNLQRIENQYRVNARLIQVADGRQLWNESLLYSETDLFQVQDAVSDMTARALIANLSSDAKETQHDRPTQNNDAYQAYLRGRYHWNQRTLEGFNTARGLFEQAISLDPKFAEAHNGLADVHLGFYDYGYKLASESIPFAVASVNQAMQLDPLLSEAYSTLASIEFLHNRDWKATEINFGRAIELAPNDPTPRLRFGWMLSVIGRTDEGLEQLLAAEKLDPTSNIGQANIAYNLMVSGKVAEAESRLHKLKINAPNFSLANWYLGTVYLLQNKPQESLEEYFTAFLIDDQNNEQIDKIRAALKKGPREEAFRIWREYLERRFGHSYFPPSNIALVAALAKDRDQTIRWLREAERVRDPWLLQVLHDPEYRFLNGDPEYDQILASLTFKK
ncbi:MAG: winged helix-turn-helix domain-containing protein [Pyrinomonadaceae bacterium]|nr:winged helix-turn-helix domain-containing protein [Pyrinomonadaceae bacterium]MBP6212532.1 winged helix-turn-helix domain-containing protein [Pyrinomonadaceae bacterium]